ASRSIVCSPSPDTRALHSFPTRRSSDLRTRTKKKRFCAVGSVKTNVGHLDPAAGVASLIKTLLALRHKQIPPSLNCENPNPAIRSEEHTSELQSRFDLVCRLLLEKKKIK